MKSLLLDVENNKVAVVDPEGLQDYYKLINCSCIDIPTRKIGRKWFNIICDDEGTFKDDPKISAIDDWGRVQLVGNLIITGPATEDGELMPLTEEDIIYISRYIQNMGTTLHPEGRYMLTQVSY